MRRRALCAASAAGGGGGGEDSIFPMYLYTMRINSYTYSHGPSPESIAFIDYYLANAELDEWGGRQLDLPDGCLYIDDICVRSVADFKGILDVVYPLRDYFAMQGIYWEIAGEDKGKLTIWDGD